MRSWTREPPPQMIEAARAAADRAYAPYSGFRVGAAVLSRTGKIHAAGNVENASYGLSLCAETNAVAAAINGGADAIVAIVVVGYRADDPDVAVEPMPCGRCRQVLNEFAAPDMMVHVYRGGERVSLSLTELLPHAFGPSALIGEP